MNKHVYLILGLLLINSCGGGGGSVGPTPAPPLPPIATECTAFLSWVAPTKRTDGALLLQEEIKKFTIFVSESPDPDDNLLSLIIDVEDSNLISWEIRSLGLRQHWFWLTVTDTAGRESEPSNVKGKDCS